MSTAKTREELALRYFERHGKIFPGTEAYLPADILKKAAEAAPAAASQEEPLYTPVDLKKIKAAWKRSAPKPEAGEPAEPAAGNSSSDEKDYFALIAEVKKRRKCGFVEAAAEVHRSNPGAWVAMLSKMNGGRDFSNKLKR
jgi:hypothetical protein